MTKNDALAAPPRHPLLTALAAQRASLRTPFPVVSGGRTFTFKLLGPEGDEWATAHTPAMRVIDYAVAQRRVLFAASLDGIDGVSTLELFPLPPEGPERAAVFARDEDNHARAERHWRREQVLAYVTDEEAIDPEDLRAFDRVYGVKDKERRAVFKEPKAPPPAVPGQEAAPESPPDFSAGTPSPSSGPPSSPEKAS